MNTPIEESNLAHIGSDEDKAAKKCAAAIEMNWEGAGESPGIQVWRVENVRDENNNPNFGINPWPKKQYGQFFDGDSYIILQTVTDEEDGGFMWDIYFWIGSGSSQDEYGVAAYKANELDDLLDDAPVQHRETEGYESPEFLACFPKGIRYLNGGIDSGFRSVEDAENATEKIGARLFHLRKRDGEKTVHMHQVKVALSSLNQGDTFVLDDADTIYTWFGTDCSPFEKSKAAQIAHGLSLEGHGHSTLKADVQDDDEDFWTILGGKGKIKEADEVQDRDLPAEEEVKMYSLSDVNSFLEFVEVEMTKSSLDTNGVFIIDAGRTVFIWIGKKSSPREQQQAMEGSQEGLNAMGRGKNTSVVRVLEGREKKNKAFKRVLKKKKSLFKSFSFF
eukprot:CAMPEP_0197823420 /NCGR_PEP_ID=MMETSP1437-20131217/750_1 /TAXON_ID=49252 ORGANISM="Eucampia antarctica, Strain CCMP1452" /NCGR_SAMPLE_ID=MMETSP1437 /ASSEMBLY_ACC=CAM_ASM_001096 /LENGTH=389 /DNA_ID=CAMNT_0043422579 /DNA_START=46 /DNA_END=1215 /DNA_ORIENTATION=+